MSIERVWSSHPVVLITPRYFYPFKYCSVGVKGIEPHTIRSTRRRWYEVVFDDNVVYIRVLERVCLESVYNIIKGLIRSITVDSNVTQLYSSRDYSSRPIRDCSDELLTIRCVLSLDNCPILSISKKFKMLAGSPERFYEGNRRVTYSRSSEKVDCAIAVGGRV